MQPYLSNSIADHFNINVWNRIQKFVFRTPKRISAMKTVLIKHLYLGPDNEVESSPEQSVSNADEENLPLKDNDGKEFWNRFFDSRTVYIQR